ncbi:MAG: hypothetical protein KME52_12045 [Desmonostoc geniculatum HA4340-LM1]|jgi:hypothetical protein|nr:hypothetical protein [Desmonostoc geniculatum HA4340-LM1]
MPRSSLLQIDPSQLVTIEEAHERLGRGYSRSSILRRIESGEWKEGVHWIDDRREGSSKRVIKINLQQVNQLRVVPAGKR